MEWLGTFSAPSHHWNQYWLIIDWILMNTTQHIPVKFQKKYGFDSWKCFAKCLNMMTSSNGSIFRVTGPLCGEFTGPGEFPAQRPVTWSFDIFFHLRPNKRLSKQPWGLWFETPSWSLWRHCNENALVCQCVKTLVSEERPTSLLFIQSKKLYGDFCCCSYITNSRRHYVMQSTSFFVKQYYIVYQPRSITTGIYIWLQMALPSINFRTI